MNRTLLIALLVSAGVVAYTVRKSWGGEKVSYNEQIRLIFNKHCLACHGGVKKSGGFSLLFREEALGKTKSGKSAIVPGDADASELVKRLVDHDPDRRMPLDAAPLNDGDIALIRNWIDQDAEWEDPWSYSPPDRQLSPPDIGGDWAKTGVDRFVYKQLAEKSLDSSPEADRATLLRRVSLDLTGLPPTPAQANLFFIDKSPDAYEQAVDRLLASPAFGERWAAMWLDLARYADSKGYEKDNMRSIWKYRDWVIRAFNADMPFDQFTVEQLAGDLLTHRERGTGRILPPTENQLIATAFHRNTMANDEGGTNDEEFRNAAIVERVGTTWEVWQGTTMACVQCHSHPYDPIRHEDFYRFAAYFNNTQDRDIYNEKPKLYTFEGANEQRVTQLINWINTRLNPADRPAVAGKHLDNQRQRLLWHLGIRRFEGEDFDSTSRHIELWDQETTVMQITDSSFIAYDDVDMSGLSGVAFRYVSGTPSCFIELHLDSLKGPLLSRAKTHSTEAKPNANWSQWKPNFAEAYAPIVPTGGMHRIVVLFLKDKEYQSDLMHLDRLDFTVKNPIYTRYGSGFRDSLLQLRDVPAVSTPILLEQPAGRRRHTHVFTRGNWLIPGASVQTGLPAIFAHQTNQALHSRLDMARWLVSRDNPLTARVMVNRFWEQLFGYGLVETLEDFGTQGFRPTHPQLLDWLAVRFQDDYHWSVKKLLRLLVTSATYRQSAQVTDGASSSKTLTEDPHNLLLSRGPRIRLSAEQIRDQALAVSGLLDRTMGGPSVLPPTPTTDAWRKKPASTYHRRAVYTFWQRTNPYPSMTTFDSPQRNICTSRRIRTNTPLQALTTLNDTVYVEAARAFATRLTGRTVLGKLSSGYERLLLRKPSQEKLALMEKLYTDTRLTYQRQPSQAALLLGEPKPTPTSPDRAALVLTVNALLNLDEVLTK